MGSGLGNKEIDNLREKCEILRKKLKDSVFKLSEYASMCSCYGEAEIEMEKIEIEVGEDLELEDE